MQGRNKSIKVATKARILATGQLRRLQRFGRTLRNSTHLGDGETTDRNFDLRRDGDHSAVSFGRHRVKGEIWEIDAATMNAIDALPLHGCDRYQRIKAHVGGYGYVWMWLFCDYPRKPRAWPELPNPEDQLPPETEL